MTRINPGIGIGGNVIGSAVFNGDGNTAYINASPPVPRTLKTKCIITLDYYFTGRTAELQQLHDAFHSSATAGVTQAISGLGGIGKSSLARAYANAHQNEYDAIFYLNASDIASLNQSYREIDRQFEPPTPTDATDAIVRQTVQSYLQTEGSYLLLVDNADFGTDYRPEDLRQYLPGNLQGHVMLTSRASSALDSLGILKNRIITLYDLEEQDAATLLWERVKGEKASIPFEQAETLFAIARALYYFPLALEQAAAHIRQQQITYLEYLNDQKRGVVKLLERQQATTGYQGDSNKYRRAVATTWNQNISAIVESGKQASAVLLGICAYLSPDAIPTREIIDGAIRIVTDIKVFFGDKPQDELLNSDYADLLRPLIDYSLITKNEGGETFNIHRMVQQVILHTILADEQGSDNEMLLRMTTLLNIAFPSAEFQNWTKCELLLNHALSIIGHALWRGYRTGLLARIMGEVAGYLYERARFQDALFLSSEALAIYRELLPANHSTVMTGMVNLSVIQYAVDDYDAAQSLLEDALTISRLCEPALPLETARILNSLGAIYKERNQKELGLPLLIEALNICREHMSPDDPQIVTILNNLGEHYMGVGEYDRASLLFDEALMKCRTLLVANHFHLSHALNSFARLRKAQGNFEDALLLSAEAVAVAVSSLGESHPTSELIMNNAMAIVVAKVLKDKNIQEDTAAAMSSEDLQNLTNYVSVPFREQVHKFIEMFKQQKDS